MLRGYQYKRSAKCAHMLKSAQYDQHAVLAVASGAEGSKTLAPPHAPSLPHLN